MATIDPTSEPNREREIFEQAVELSVAERPGYLDRVCGGDEVLRGRVQALLRGHEAPAAFLSETPAGPSRERVEDGVPGPGHVIGRYKLLEQIGEGGFGIVYMAEQFEPVTRKVALKIIKPGMDSRQVIGRFETERQALALMDHPNIAKVFDAGATAAGLPFFVMELVRGMPITQFCEEEGLDMESRLELFIQVCSAVQHAHQKGIIHRDLKPTNILVTLHGEQPVPKVIDFGIAKATHQPLTDKTIFTLFQQFLGTPAYMSPEQAALSGLDIDTRSDVYSLGVLLYELLTGTPPFDSQDLLRSGVDEMRRTIREKEPERPSTRLRRLSRVPARENRSPVPAGLASDLDRIVLKALEKDRERRYATANGLAADLRRFLNQEPVSAVAPTFAYQIAKFARRHRRAAVTAVAFIALLGVAVVVSLGLALRARRAEVVAESRADTAQSMSEFYWKALLKQLAPWHHTNPVVSLREAFDLSAGEIRERLSAKPLAEASVRLVYGKTYTGLSEYGLAETNLMRAEELIRAHEVPPGDATAEILTQLATLRSFQHNNSAAERLLDEVAAIQMRKYPPNHKEVVNPAARAMLLRATRLPASESIPLLRELIQRSREVLGTNHHITLQAMNRLGIAQVDLGGFEEACDLFAETRRLAAEDEGAASNGALASLDLLAATRARQGKYEVAEDLFRELIDVRHRVNLPDHLFTLMTRLSQVGFLLMPQRRFQEAGDQLLEIAGIVWDRRPTLKPAMRLHFQALLREWKGGGGGDGFEAFQGQVQARGYLEPSM